MTRDNRPPRERLIEYYRDLISSGALSAGTLLPSNRAVAQRWGISTATVEKAFASLRSDGLVRGIAGVGTEVIGGPSALSAGSQRHDRATQTGSSWGPSERSDSHTAVLTEAPADVALQLQREAGESVICRTRVYRDSHGVVAHSTSWIPGELGDAVPELLRPERLPGGTSVDMIAQATGRRVVRREHVTTPRIASQDDLAILEHNSVSPAAILVISTLFLDSDGYPVEYGVDRGAPGRSRFDSSDTK